MNSLLESGAFSLEVELVSIHGEDAQGEIGAIV